MVGPTALSIGLGVASVALFFLGAAGPSALAILPVSLIPLPLLAAALSLGLAGAAIATASAIATLVVTGERIEAVGVFAATFAAPALVVARLAPQFRQATDGRTVWYPPGRLLLWLIGYGLAVFAVALAVTADQEGGLQGAATRHLTAAAAMGATMPLEPAVIEVMAVLLPGLMIVIWLTILTLNGALAQGLMGRFGRLPRPAMRLVDLELPPWTALAFAASAAAATMVGGTAGMIAATLALATGFAFLLAGLGVIHGWLDGKPAKSIALALLYASFLMTWPALAVAGLGIVDQWARFRRGPSDQGT